MLNWLKKKAKVSFSSRYPNILRRSESPEMFLPDQTMIGHEASSSKSQVVNLRVYNLNGKEYSLNVPPEMSLEKIKKMAVGHFYNPKQAVGESPKFGSDSSVTKPSFRLILVKDYRNLIEEKSVFEEGLMDNDEILLVECRASDYKHPILCGLEINSRSYSKATAEKIKEETAHLSSLNAERHKDNSPPSPVDFKIALRQILMTMIEVSIHLITLEDNAADLFVLVFEHLEKRHKPRVDKNSLKQLTDMGFSEARAIKALQLKGNVEEATDWLLDETNKTKFGSSDADSDVLLIPPERRKSFFMSGNDPAEKVMQEFNRYVEKWFVPDPRALKNLKDVGYGEDISKEALRITCNNEVLAKDFLEGKTAAENFKKGFDRDSHIMTAILESPVVQVALSKPKTLFALMVLCETPSNVNVWLSDPETHPVVSQILRIYHLEKHRLNENLKTTSSTEADFTDEDAAAPSTDFLDTNDIIPNHIGSGSASEVLPQASTSLPSTDRMNTTEDGFSPWSKELDDLDVDSSDNMDDLDPV